jgi:hypothetical protein
VLVKALLLSDMGVSYCGGVIGKDGRMCIAFPCSVASHRLNKCWPSVRKDDSADNELLCISCATTGGSSKPSAVFVEPTIPSKKLRSSDVTEKRPVGAWGILFRSLQESSLTTEEAAELEEWSSRSSPARGLMTPRKARKPLRVRKLASNDDDVVTVLQPISEELGPITETTIDALRVAWEPLLANQSTLQDTLAGHAVALAEFEAGELRTTRLEDDVGERTAESGNQSLFQLAAAAEDELSNLSTRMGIELSDLSATIADTSKMVLDQLGTQLESVLAPLLSLFGALSSEKASPGDKLERRLKLMQAEISQLKASEGRSHGAGFFGNDTPGAILDARGGPQQLHQLTETVATMQALLQSMWDQLASELVKVGTVNFISRSFTKNWLKTEGRNAQIVFFVDARSLLELIHDSSYSTSSLCPLTGSSR